MSKDYKTRIYESYSSNLFEQNENIIEIDRYYMRDEAYFKKNYLQFMPVNKSSSIIDVGCGLGTFLNFANNQGYTDIIGIDLSDENIAMCDSKGFVVEKADAFTFLACRESTFDLIVFNDVIEHLEKQEIFNMLDIMRNALTVDGTLIIKAPNMANPYVGATSLSIDFTHQLCFTETSLRQVLLTIGFSDITIVGTDIYVRKNIINFLAKSVAKLICFDLYIKSWLFGRKTIKIFQKNLLAIAKKKSMVSVQ